MCEIWLDLFNIILNSIYLDFELFVGQNKQFKEVTLRWAFFFFFLANSIFIPNGLLQRNNWQIINKTLFLNNLKCVYFVDKLL